MLCEGDPDVEEVEMENSISGAVRVNLYLELRASSARSRCGAQAEKVVGRGGEGEVQPLQRQSHHSVSRYICACFGSGVLNHAPTLQA